MLFRSKRYYSNKQLKSVENSENDLLTGEYEEFHENGRRSVQSFYMNGKTTGESIYSDEDGKKTALFVFENERVIKATYFNKDGTSIPSSSIKDGQLYLINYDAMGRKLGVVYTGTVEAGVAKTAQINILRTNKTMLFYKLIVGDKTVKGTVVPE